MIDFDKKNASDAEFRYDIASGFNQNRPAYRAILERAINGNSLLLVATTSDRITRTGFALIRWIVELSGGQILLLEEADSTEQFDYKTLITSFVNSHYRKRSAKRNHNFTKNQDLSQK